VIYLAKKDIKRGIRYEKKKAKSHGARHVGGPGKEDYRRGNVKGEVKNRKTAVTKPELQKMFKKGITEVESKSGFTNPAIEYKRKYHPDKKLFKKGRPVK